MPPPSISSPILPTPQKHRIQPCMSQNSIYIASFCFTRQSSYNAVMRVLILILVLVLYPLLLCFESYVLRYHGHVCTFFHPP